MSRSKKKRDMVQWKPAYFYQQSGVIPYRWRQAEETHKDGLDVLLITTRKQKRWIIPKGIVEPDLSPRESAAKEAFEEAGIEGEVAERPIGNYTREKWGGTCTIQVFPFQVTNMLDEWPEGDRRKREWLRLEDAAARVQEDQLKTLLCKLPEYLD